MEQSAASRKGADDPNKGVVGADSSRRSQYPPPDYSSCTSSTDSSDVIRSLYTDFPFWADFPGEESEDTQRYVDYIEHIKQVLFPGSIDLASIPPRLRLCVAYVEEELFELQRQKKRIVRRQSELLYILQDAILEDDCARLRCEVNKATQIPDDQKTENQRKREEKLVREIVNVVHKRNTILEDLHIERMREMEEDEELAQIYSLHKGEWMKLSAISNGQSNNEKPASRKKNLLSSTTQIKEKVYGASKSCTLI